MASESNTVMRIFCALLALLGLGIYLYWGVVFGVWVDIGLYSITALLLGFGIVGYLLYSSQ